MKTVINIVLSLVACALIYICYASIMGPINFEKSKKVRDRQVIANLIDIRKAQLEYRAQHEQQYTASFDSLIDFVKNAKIPFVLKEGVLSDDQLEDGLTERKAMQIINKAKKTGNYRDVKKKGLEDFKRDTLWVAVLDTIYPKTFNADSLRFVPFTNGTAEFSLATRQDSTKSGIPLYLFEAKVPYKVYLNGLDHQEIVNIVDLKQKLDKYPGLMVGSVESPNNNAGNWE